MRKTYLLILFTAISVTSFAQITWPVITNQTKPWARWWWQGSAVNKPDLATNMEKYAGAGLGGLEITPIYGVKGQESKFIKYLSPQWVDMLGYTLQQAKRLDMGIDMANATGWPFGGPWIDDESASKTLAYKTYELKGGESLAEPVIYMQQTLVSAEGKAPAISDLVEPIAANKNLQALALDQVRFPKLIPLQVLMAYDAKGQSLNITDKVDGAGKLNWVAPKGNWTLYAVFMGLHGKMVERAAPGGEGFVIDHFSKDALHTYLAHFDQAFKGHDVSGLRSFFNDSYEVDDARGQSNFTPAFFSEFKTRRGYDLQEHLPALFAKDTKENNDRVLCDYRETISDLLLDDFTKPWHDWAKSRGALIRNQSHGSPSNILDLYSAVDIPETEGKEPLRFRFATSAAHVMGKKLASSESATWLNEHFTSSLSDVKQSIDQYFLGGVNHVFYHGISYSPPSAPFPGWLFYAAVHFVPANPIWNDFSALNEYIARCQSFLQSGKPDNDVLLYYPIFDSFSEAGRGMLKHYDGMRPEFTGTNFEANAQKMLDKGYSFDYISDRQIVNLQASTGGLATGGNRYQTIVVPGCHYMPLATLQKLIGLARSGSTVILYKNAPVDVPGFNKLDDNRKAFKQLLLNLNFTDAGNGVKKAVTGSGSVLLGDDIEQLLAYAKIRRESFTDKNLQFTRRQYDGGNYYFIANNGSVKADGWVALSGAPASVVLFDPMFNKSGLAPVRKTASGLTEVYLQLSPGQSCILQTSNTIVKGDRFAYYKATGETVDIKGVWAVKFTGGGPELPADLKQSQLISWTEFGGDEVKRFSGMAKYSISFSKPATKVAVWRLELGKVYESADIYINGKHLAKLIGPDFSVDIPSGDLLAVNQLEVSVSNLMANRVSDMDRRKIPYRIFYNTNFPARMRENRGDDGLFSAAKWEPRPSGLVGPVKLVALEPLAF